LRTFLGVPLHDQNVVPFLGKVNAKTGIVQGAILTFRAPARSESGTTIAHSRRTAIHIMKRGYNKMTRTYGA
jgi:hypothetical protein